MAAGRSSGSGPDLGDLSQLASDGDRSGLSRALEKLLKTSSREEVRVFLASSDFGDRGSRSALHMAAFKGRASILSMLLDAGGDPNAADDGGNTGLHHAASAGHARAVALLLSRRAMPDCRNGFGRSPADLAASSKWDPEPVAAGKQLVLRLLQGEALPDSALPKEPPMVRRRDVPKELRVPKEPTVPLPKKGPSFSVADVSTVACLSGDSGSSEASVSLLDTVRRGSVEEVTAWLEHIRESSEDEETAEAEIMKLISNCECEDEDTRVAPSAMHLAASLGKADIMKLLLSTRVDPNCINDAGDTPLHCAAGAGRFAVAQELMRASANPTALNNFGRSPVHMAAPQAWDSVEVQQNKLKVAHLLRACILSI
mmetsp:Transcript_55875/g.120862  ORF Transcript_55875/g.120862 Transcript_55875/m.120862 type:complete len:371 (-) Transcript_55875:50-1162(-)